VNAVARAAAPRPAVVLALITALAVLGLPACSAVPAAPGERIVLGYSAWPGWFPWRVAEEWGLFRANGVDVELRYFDSYTDSLAALAAGEIDANSQTLNDTVASISSGARQTVVLVNDNSTGNDKIIARAGVQGLADLRGKRVAVEQGTVDHYLLLLALAEVDLGPGDIELVPLPTAEAVDAFLAGQVDAVGAFAPFTSAALELPGSRAVATSAEFPGAIPDHLVVRADLAAERPDAVQAVVDTWFDTLDAIRSDRAAAIAVMARQAGVDEEQYASYESGTTVFTRGQNLDAFTPGTTSEHLNHQARQIASFLVEAGLIATEPDLSGMLDARFVQAVDR
jgi:NitT/TauT family transport system substrate-binding protein